jgi:hypothetical protein
VTPRVCGLLVTCLAYSHPEHRGVMVLRNVCVLPNYNPEFIVPAREDFSPNIQSNNFVMTMYVLSGFRGVTIDGVWIGEWIY